MTSKKLLNNIKSLALEGSSKRCKIKNEINGHSLIGAYLFNKKLCLLQDWYQLL